MLKASLFTLIFATTISLADDSTDHDPIKINPSWLPTSTELTKAFITEEGDRRNNSVDEMVGLLDKQSPEKKGSLWDIDYVDLKTDSPDWINVTPDLSVSFINAWKTAIQRGTKYIDITSLSPPTGIYLTALKAAVRALDQKKTPIRIRILFSGSLPDTFMKVDVWKLLKELNDEIDQDSQLEIHVGAFRSSNIPPSWNHTKIVAVDNQLLVTGGHIVLDEGYSTQDQVHDVTVTIPGHSAILAHHFVDELWNYTCKNVSFFTQLTGSIQLWSRLPGQTTLAKGVCPRNFDTREFPTTTAPRVNDPTPVITVGKLGQIDPANNANNPSDFAITHLIQRSKKAVFISQQAIYPLFFYSDFNNAVVAEIAQAVLRQVDVYILTSRAPSDRLAALKEAYTAGVTPDGLLQYIFQYMKDHPKDFPQPSRFLPQLSRHLHVLTTANELGELRNHSKIVISDTDAAYVGSSNLYDAGLAEFGVILCDNRAVRNLLERYYFPLWQSSLAAFLNPRLR
jgi:phosphatidylserine/phosphatidylglycerophosphate/cardiolipin synthase-like enzyme